MWVDAAIPAASCCSQSGYSGPTRPERTGAHRLATVVGEIDFMTMTAPRLE